MAQKPETLFSNNLRKKLPEDVYSMKNNNEYIAGIPDLWFSGNRADLWAEMKFVSKLPVRVALRPMDLLSALQDQWLSERYAEGRNVCVIIGCKREKHYEGIILRNLEWRKDIPPTMLPKVIRPMSELVDFVVRSVKQ